jgi:glycosyltransferase involved in cell wall biosynthesis
VVDGLVADGRPIPRLLVVGFGSFEEGLQDLWSSIQSADLDSASRTAQRGRELEGEQSGGKLRILSDFLRNPPEGYAEMGRVAANSVLWAGRLDHDEVAEVLPVSDALVMPSTFPEAFGMVAAEAAACGVPFVSADHSGMLEVSKRLGEALDPEAAPFLSFSVESDAIEQLADCLLHWLRMEPAEQAWISERLASAASDSYSWPAMAAALVAAASGDLDKLPHP